MIPVTASLALDERDLEERFIRASGPGGQNVNKVSTAVELRFNMNGFTEMPDDVRARLACNDLRLNSFTATQRNNDG